jgi:hypothetical protein
MSEGNKRGWPWVVALAVSCAITVVLARELWPAKAAGGASAARAGGGAEAGGVVLVESVKAGEPGEGRRVVATGVRGRVEELILNERPVTAAELAAMPRLGELCAAGDANRVNAALEGMGMPNWVRRDLVSRVANRKADLLLAELRAAATPADWWRAAPPTSAELEENPGLAELRKQANETMGKLFPPEEGPTVDEARRRALGFIPEESRDLVLAKEAEFDRQIRELRDAKFSVPSDDVRIKELETAKQEAVAALLSPEQAADYALFTGEAAEELKYLMVPAGGTEEEFRALMPEAKRISGQLKKQKGDEAKADAGSDTALKVELGERMRDVLGEERARLVMRAAQPDYRTLAAAADRLALPEAKVEEIYAVRAEVAETSLNLAEAAGLSPDAKKAALARLAKDTRDRVTAAMGEEAGRVYLETAMTWLKDLEQGAVLEFLPETEEILVRR